MERKLVVLALTDGSSPVEDWVCGLRDKPTRLKILRQIDKLKRGLGEQKNLNGISELKIDLGPGYRVYYALLDRNTLVVLLGGGDKSSQSKDIVAARQLWQDFKDSGQAKTSLRAWNETQAPAEDITPEAQEASGETGEPS